jgi:hypothetical protein
LKLCVGNASWGNLEGKHFFRESLKLWREAGDLRGIALSQVWLGWKDDIEGEEDRAIVDESVARRLDHRLVPQVRLLASEKAGHKPVSKTDRLRGGDCSRSENE